MGPRSRRLVPSRLSWLKGVDGVRVGKPPGARGGIQILGMVRGEWPWLAPQAYGGGAGCWVIAGTWPPPGGSCSPSSMALRVGTPSPLVLCGGSSSSVALCVGSPSPMALRVGTPSLVALCAGSPSLALCAGSPSLVALCAGSTSPSCLCVGTGLGCRSTSSCSVASACCWTVCSRPGVASFCEGLFFCVATQSCVSLQPEAYLSLSFVHSRSCQGVLTLCWSVGPLKLSHPWCLLPRLLNQCRLVFVLLGSVLWVVCSRGFVSRSFRCWGFLTSFHLCGLPCLDHVPVPSRH